MSKQAAIENRLGLTEAEAAFINANPRVPAVRAFKSLLSIQVEGYDPGGFALLEAAMEEVRAVIAADERAAS